MKCQSCGAELNPNSKFCDSCGAQISLEMRREQEQLNRAGCPVCGSSNVSFSREKQGEIRGKKGTSVVRKTVGVCKDCGHTWVVGGQQQPQKSKTWLWVLGWIFIFPVPLTILMLRNKTLKPVVRYIIIGVAWLIYLLIGFGGGSGDKEKPKETPTSNAPAVIVENNTAEAAPAEDKLDVTLKVDPNVNADDGSVLFSVTTNLPEDTQLLITVSNDSGFTAQDKTVVLANGTANTSEFSDNGAALSGKYTVNITMPIPSTQKDTVKAVIGDKGEKLGGQYVQDSDIGDSKIISGDFDFEF